MMHIGDEVTLPVYLMKDSRLFASSEVTIARLTDVFTGVLELQNNFLPTEIRPRKRNSRIAIPLYLVYGPRGERVPVGELKMSLQGERFIGFVNIGLLHEQEMSTARSLVNVEY